MEAGMDAKQPPWRRFGADVQFFIAALFAVLLIRESWVGPEGIRTIPYSEFRALLDKGGVTDLVIGPTRIVAATRSWRTAGSGASPPYASSRSSPKSVGLAREWMP
jgi:hypothetical protein